MDRKKKGNYPYWNQERQCFKVWIYLENDPKQKTLSATGQTTLECMIKLNKKLKLKELTPYFSSTQLEQASQITCEVRGRKGCRPYWDNTIKRFQIVIPLKGSLSQKKNICDRFYS